jgi:hypothetical protein
MMGEDTPRTLSQKAEKQAVQCSFVGEQINYHILRHVVESVSQVDDLLVLADGSLIHADDALDHGHGVHLVRRRLQPMLISRQLQRAWEAAAQNVDSVRQTSRVFQLEGDLFFERFTDRFRFLAVQVDRVGELRAGGLTRLAHRRA